VIHPDCLVSEKASKVNMDYESIL